MLKNDTNDPAIEATRLEEAGNNIVKAEGFVNSIAISASGLIFASNNTDLAVSTATSFNFIN
jgi:hypothetical protein